MASRVLSIKKTVNERGLEIILLLSSLVTNAWMEPNHVLLDSTYNTARILRTVYLGYDRVSMCNVSKLADRVPQICVSTK